MEMKAFTESLFLPLMIQREVFDESTMVAFNLEGIMNLGTWIEDESGLCYIPDLMKIEVCFDGDLNDYENFDPTKAEIFSIVATTPSGLDPTSDAPLTEDQNTNMLKNIMNCFRGDMITLPEQLKIFDDLLGLEWSYRIAMDQRIYPCVVKGDLVFECI